MDVAGGEGDGEREGDIPPQMADFSVKALKLTGLTVEMDSEHVQDHKPNQSLDGIIMCSLYYYTLHNIRCIHCTSL